VTVEFDDSVWGPLPHMPGTTENVQVVGADRVSVEQALGRAASRMMNVAEDGRELTDAEFEANDATGELYTPNGVYVVQGRDVPTLRANCKNSVSGRMRETFLAIVADELQRAGINDVRVEPDPGEAAELGIDT
jgi:hypothetical protein